MRMKSTNVNDKRVKVTEFEYYDEYLETNVEVVLVYDMKKFYIVISKDSTTEVKEYRNIDDLIKDFVKSENKQLVYAEKIKELKTELDEMYK